MTCSICCFFFFVFNDTATTEIYTLSLHDALPISPPSPGVRATRPSPSSRRRSCRCPSRWRDRKSTRLNSSHEWISYDDFCLKKKTFSQEEHLWIEIHLHITVTRFFCMLCTSTHDSAKYFPSKASCFFF